MQRILVVEDSRTQAEQLRGTLEEAGFAVEVAPDGERGFALFDATGFDLVLTDIIMPGMSGYELCRRLKAHPSRGWVPVILLTTLRAPLDILQGIECGADNFLTKPYHPKDLLARIRYLLATRGQRGRGRSRSRVKVGVEVTFLGKTFTITSENEQILDLLITTCEDVVRTHGDLRASQDELEEAKAQVELRNTQLQRAREELEERVRERTAELAQANEALRQEVEDRKRLETQLLHAQKMDAVGRLAGGVAHDFNNLLTIITGYSELLLAGLRPDEPLRGLAAEITRAGERAASLTRQLLAFSRQQVVAPKVLDLNAIVADVGKMLQRLIGENIQINWQPGVETKTVDLGRQEVVSAVGMTVGTAAECFPNEFTVETSPDGSEWTVMARALGLKIPAAKCLWQRDGGGCRYVRIKARRVRNSKDGLYYVKMPSISVYSALPGSCIEATWQATCDDGNTTASGEAAEYDLRYSATPMSEGSFAACTRVLNTPEPGAAGSTEKCTFSVLDESEVYAGLKTGDEVPNWSPLMTAGPLFLKVRGFVSLDPADGSQYVSDGVIPTFRFKTDTEVTSFSIILSNSSAFPLKATIGPDGVASATIKYGLKQGATEWTPTSSTWKNVKKAAGPLGTIYWRLEGKHNIYGVVYGPIRRLHFECGNIRDMQVQSSHEVDCMEAIWPAIHLRPIFEWYCERELLRVFQVEVATNSSFTPGTTSQTKVLVLGKKGVNWQRYKATAGEWKAIKQMAAARFDTEKGYATLFWRVRARAADKLTQAVSPVKVLLIDAGELGISDIDLSQPAPKAVWTSTATGFLKFRIEFSTDASFPVKGGLTMKMPGSGTTMMEYTLTSGDVAKLQQLALKGRSTVLYYRLRAEDAEKAFIAYGPTKSTAAP